MLTKEILSKNGGPVFPCHNDADIAYNWNWRGMTLRDYFAAQTITGQAQSTALAPEVYRAVARDAYRLADAMIAERNKEQS